MSCPILSKAINSYFFSRSHLRSLITLVYPDLFPIQFSPVGDDTKTAYSIQNLEMSWDKVLPSFLLCSCHNNTQHLTCLIWPIWTFSSCLDGILSHMILWTQRAQVSLTGHFSAPALLAAAVTLPFRYLFLCTKYIRIMYSGLYCHYGPTQSMAPTCCWGTSFDRI